MTSHEVSVGIEGGFVGHAPGRLCGRRTARWGSRRTPLPSPPAPNGMGATDRRVGHSYSGGETVRT